MQRLLAHVCIATRGLQQPFSPNVAHISCQAFPLLHYQSRQQANAANSCTWHFPHEYAASQAINTICKISEANPSQCEWGLQRHSILVACVAELDMICFTPMTAFVYGHSIMCPTKAWPNNKAVATDLLLKLMNSILAAAASSQNFIISAS